MASRLGSLFVRRFAAAAEGGGDHAGGARVWKIMSFVVALPGVVVCWANAFMHHEHEEERNDFVAFEHLRLRTKKFPWGDGNHTLFHNKHLNALPEGYEEMEEECA
ncbi:cytochrome c oxidase subunit 6A, mitochondrial-like [Gigantopelta aegis]|uniref:cytochrome c oxidase subunit 6A, mitochondrial-like n=1 Tax=Gigantopelta aegis TaxID=1735272 RepID=UPI001B88CB04|nr:cytochrome c oxidase subunit 6A, mitochondrial-like [Gigantopelta aegis]